MNREIEFRAWHKVQRRMYGAEEMAAGQLTLLPTGKFINVSSVDTRLSRIFDHMIPLQYTGFKNKNGKKIFEGDIIAIPNQYPFYDDGKPNYLATVEFIYGCWQRVLHCVNPENRGISDGINEILEQSDGASKEYEVLGNIYENPGLINGCDQEDE